MPEETSLAVMFDGKDIRAIEREGDVWIPIMDIASAWGIDRSTPDNIIKRNAEVFDGLSTSVFDVTSNTTIKCLNERGLYLMMGKVTAGRAKNKDAQTTIIRFQKWFPELIQQYRRKELALIASPANLAADLKEAKDLAIICERPPSAFQEIVFRKHNMPEYADALKIPAETPAIVSHSETGWMNPSDIGFSCGGLKAQDINQYLYNKGYQIKDSTDPRIWRLTPQGEEFGEEYLFQLTNKHSEIRIRWRKEIILASGLKREESSL
jgi:prophage antirepressor-like protein/predicted transcriptional regulator